MEVFALKDLTFTYAGAIEPTLRHVNLEIAPGSYLCICGRSGSGKTTLLRHLKSVLTPFGETSGEVLFNGKPLQEASDRDQSSLIGFVMQNPDAQIVTDKVWHELAFGLESLGVDQQTMQVRIAEMASYFGIESWFHKDVNELSGGQKQVLNLASVMAMHPSVLILDEPTGQLDPIAAADFLNMVRKINLELGTTIVITEQRLENVFAAADEVVVLENGAISAQGAPRVVADKLYTTGNPMTYALSAPVRVFYSVEESVSEPRTEECPLTVREGRSWLADRVLNYPPARTTLPEEELSHSGELAIQMKDVWFRYERNEPDVLRGVNVEIPVGTTFAFVGRNGTGKSTLLKCACGVLEPYRGKVRLFDKALKNYRGASLHHGCVAMLPQDPQNLFVKNTVRSDLAEILTDMHLSKEEQNARIREVAETCDIVSHLDSHPFDLSGGEQQRAALAKVLLTEPRLLLLDEPTKGVDNVFKRELARLFGRLKAQGITIVLVSHDVEFCAQFADSVALLFDGQVVTTDTPRKFFSNNSFYTTAANRMSRGVFKNAITYEDVIELCTSL